MNAYHVQIGFICCLIAGAALLAWAAVTEPARQREFNAAADITVNGAAVSVYVIVDKKQGKSWKAVIIDRGAVIIPGSEQTLPLEQKP